MNHKEWFDQLYSRFWAEHKDDPDVQALITEKRHLAANATLGKDDLARLRWLNDTIDAQVYRWMLQETRESNERVATTEQATKIVNVWLGNQIQTMADRAMAKAEMEQDFDKANVVLNNTRDLWNAAKALGLNPNVNRYLAFVLDNPDQKFH